MPEPMVVRPGSGERLTGSMIVGRAEWSGGLAFVLEQTIEPGVLIGAHRHARETQGAYVMAGEIGFYVDGVEYAAGAGTYLVRPAGSVHAAWNTSRQATRMIEITTPGADLQALARELRRFHQEGNRDPAKLAALAASHGTTLEPEVTSMLAARHGLIVKSGYAVSGSADATGT